MNKNQVSFLDYAVEVLSKASQPLTAQEIWEIGVNLGLDKKLSTVGKTPWQTLTARLYVCAKKKNSHGIMSIGDKPKKFLLSAQNSTSQQLSLFSELQNEMCVNVDEDKKRPNNKKVAHSFTEAAQMVLEKFGDKKPLHYGKITEIALSEGFVISNSKHPEATMYAQIIQENQRKTKRGEEIRFIQHGKGFVGLSKWMSKGLRLQVEQHNRDVKKKLHARLMKMSPKDFEELIGRLLMEMGFDGTTVTTLSGDQGVDVRGTWVVTEGVNIKMAVQVKRWKHNVGRPIVQALRGSLSNDERGLIITTSDFPDSAKLEAEDPKKASPISLINGDRLVSLLVEHNLGVERERIDILELKKDED